MLHQAPVFNQKLIYLFEFTDQPCLQTGFAGKETPTLDMSSSKEIKYVNTEDTEAIDSSLSNLENLASDPKSLNLKTINNAIKILSTLRNKTVRHCNQVVMTAFTTGE